jgi:nucleoside phosphorylase
MVIVLDITNVTIANYHVDIIINVLIAIGFINPANVGNNKVF